MYQKAFETLLNSLSMSNSAKSPSLRITLWYKYTDSPELLINPCFCCSMPISALDFDIGHVLASSVGGERSVQNCRPICRPCNSEMSNRHMFEWMKARGYDRPYCLEDNCQHLANCGWFCSQHQKQLFANKRNTPSLGNVVNMKRRRNKKQEELSSLLTPNQSTTTNKQNNDKCPVPNSINDDTSLITVNSDDTDDSDDGQESITAASESVDVDDDDNDNIEIPISIDTNSHSIGVNIPQPTPLIRQEIISYLNHHNFLNKFIAGDIGRFINKEGKSNELKDTTLIPRSIGSYFFLWFGYTLGMRKSLRGKDWLGMRFEVLQELYKSYCNYDRYIVHSNGIKAWTSVVSDYDNNIVLSRRGSALYFLFNKEKFQKWDQHFLCDGPFYITGQCPLVDNNTASNIYDLLVTDQNVTTPPGEHQQVDNRQTKEVVKVATEMYRKLIYTNPVAQQFQELLFHKNPFLGTAKLFLLLNRICIDDDGKFSIFDKKTRLWRIYEHKNLYRIFATSICEFLDGHLEDLANYSKHLASGETRYSEIFTTNVLNTDTVCESTMESWQYWEEAVAWHQELFNHSRFILEDIDDPTVNSALWCNRHHRLICPSHKEYDYNCNSVLAAAAVNPTDCKRYVAGWSLADRYRYRYTYLFNKDYIHSKKLPVHKDKTAELKLRVDQQIITLTAVRKRLSDGFPAERHGVINQILSLITNKEIVINNYDDNDDYPLASGDNPIQTVADSYDNNDDNGNTSPIQYSDFNPIFDAYGICNATSSQYTIAVADHMLVDLTTLQTSFRDSTCNLVVACDQKGLVITLLSM